MVTGTWPGSARSGPAGSSPNLDAVREAAVELGADPDRTSAPLDDSVVNRAAHGVGWVFGSIGEAVDRVVGKLRS